MHENQTASIEGMLELSPRNAAERGSRLFSWWGDAARSLYRSTLETMANPGWVKDEFLSWGRVAGFALLTTLAAPCAQSRDYLVEDFTSTQLPQALNVQTGGGLSSTNQYGSGLESILGKGRVYQASLGENQGFTFYFTGGEWFTTTADPKSVYWLESWVGANDPAGVGFDLASANGDSVSDGHIVLDEGNTQRFGVLSFADDFPVGQGTYLANASSTRGSSTRTIEFDDFSRTALPHFSDYLSSKTFVPYLIGDESFILAAGAPNASYTPGDVVFYPVSNRMDIQLQPGEAETLFFTPLQLDEPGYVLLRVRYETANPSVQLALAQLEADDPLPGSELPFAFTNRVYSQIATLRDGETSLDLYVLMHARNMTVPLIQAALPGGPSTSADPETIVRVHSLDACLLPDFNNYLIQERQGTYGNRPTGTPEPSATAAATPTRTPSPTPTLEPSPTYKPPSPSPTPTPTRVPSPTPAPTGTPSPAPTNSPIPTFTPTATPSPTYTPFPTLTPTATPTPLETRIEGLVIARDTGATIAGASVYLLEHYTNQLDPFAGETADAVSSATGYFVLNAPRSGGTVQLGVTGDSIHNHVGFAFNTDRERITRDEYVLSNSFDMAWYDAKFRAGGHKRFWPDGVTPTIYLDTNNAPPFNEPIPGDGYDVSFVLDRIKERLNEVTQGYSGALPIEIGKNPPSFKTPGYVVIRWNDDIAPGVVASVGTDFDEQGNINNVKITLNTKAQFDWNAPWSRMTPENLYQASVFKEFSEALGAVASFPNADDLERSVMLPTSQVSDFTREDEIMFDHFYGTGRDNRSPDYEAPGNRAPLVSPSLAAGQNGTLSVQKRNRSLYPLNPTERR